MRKLRSFDAIIFDMDGLLVDTESVWEEAESAMLAGYNVVMEPEVRAQLIGLRNDVFITKLKDLYNISDSLESLQSNVVDRMLALIPVKAKPMPGGRWRINLYRCDYANKAFLALNPVLVGSFHTPERFGVLEFTP